MSLASNILDSHTPTGREEAWRFTPLKRLGGMHDGSAKIEVRDSLNPTHELPSGVSFTRGLISALTESDDVIVRRIREFTGEGATLTVSANSEINEPIYLGRNKGGINTVEFSRLRIDIESNARATVVIENTGNSHIGEDLEISLAPGSHLRFISLQEWEAESIYAARHHAVIDRDASLDSTVVTLGGNLVRILPTVDLIGQGSDVKLSGIYFATEGQFFEHRMFVDHKVAHAKSRVNYKGALAGEGAHTVWIGDVFIRAAAEGTDTYELNRNLLLSDGARADSVPNLEIETGEIVGAGHASTTGRFDDEQLFYLMSRGIRVEDARRLVVRGFFNEIVSEIGIENIQERLMARIDFELEKAGR